VLPDDRLRVFFDANVLIAAAPSSTGASFLLLRLSESGLIHGCTCPQVLHEAARNVRQKVPSALPVFQGIIAAANLTVVPDATPGLLTSLQGLAHADDLPILACAIEAHCAFLTTFNVRHYQIPGSRIRVIRPGDLVSRLRRSLAQTV
jgi:predicted nucleic acid-binding protein